MSVFNVLQVHLKESAVPPESRQAGALRRHAPSLNATLGEADVAPSLRRAARISLYAAPHKHTADSRFSPARHETCQVEV